jgi:DNA-binding FrmR family transcriptional regulator
MAEEALSQELLLRRLRRIEGQVGGVQGMIGNGRDCESLITQLSAIRSAIESVGTLVINDCMKLTLRSDVESSDIDALARAVCIWARGAG